MEIIEKDIGGALLIPTTDKNKKEVSLDREINSQIYNLQSEEFSISLSELQQRGFVTNESWESIEQIQAKIIQSNKEIVHCECLLDKETLFFQVRKFPISLFSHLELYNGKPIIIKIRNKAGASRMDILEGKGIVNTDLFDLNDSWEELRDSELDAPFQI